ncbi:serine (or cysteine) peptidase inhibitor, clade H, member 2 [Lampris incognitus]|uniref:serine (or cysteine) peptidase inhibitor, clade H, member 2 n=1 Tax=Lampris incognitus TaxID=2546036 RepID=UPI0024B6310C|nr:serine (or cysteine) peptidase inhibitor, clade H, member 2 [Lampris incognitus]
MKRSAMLRRHFVCLLAFLAALLVLGSTTDSVKETPAAPASAPPRPPSPLSDPSWALGLRLYQVLRSTRAGSQNTLFSPLLLASSLGALSGGSRGTTSSQLLDLLKTPSPPKAGPQAGEILSQALRSLAEANGTSFRLHSSSSLFSKQAPSIDLAFVKESQARFGLQHQPLGKGDSKADLEQLHAWAKAGLGGLDGAPLGAEIKANAGALLLANALNFKGLWEREFGEDSMDRRTFLGTKYTKVQMMHKAGLHRHYEDMENMVQVLEIGLSGGKVSMVLLLPFHIESLTRLDKLLTVEILTSWLEKTTDMSIAISLPKANITSTLSLQKQLAALGLTDAWDQKTADFSGVSSKSRGKLHLGSVLHWASLELAAEAGEGAAKLGDEMLGKPKLFYADHSFIVLVRDNATGALLLIGALDHAEGEALHDEL